MRVTLTLPYPPSANNLYAVVNGRKVLSKAGREYHEAVADSVRKQGIPKFGRARIAYSVTAFVPDNRRRDLSNLAKAMEDALTKAEVWGDDCQVDHFAWTRGHVAPGGSIFVEIEEIKREGAG